MRAGVLAALLLAACVPLKAAAPPVPPVAEGVPVDFVLVQKSARTLTLYAAGHAVRTYSGLQFGGAPVGPKRFEGDGKTPEGRYTIDARNRASAFHLSLHISYPGAADRAFAARQGRSPGGDIFIHGQPNDIGGGRMAGDWTAGCISVSDSEIEELWSLIPDGTPIQIDP